MKKTVSLATLLLIGVMAHAQLAQTKWKGQLLVPKEIETWLYFKSDTLDVFVSNGNSLLESISYTLVHDTILIRKLSGRSPCDASITGKYKWLLKDNTLVITPIADDCADRYRAWAGQPFVRQ